MSKIPIHWGSAVFPACFEDRACGTVGSAGTLSVPAMAIVFEWLERIGGRTGGGLARSVMAAYSPTRWRAGLGYAVPKFKERGVDSPFALMSLRADEYEAGACSGLV